MKSILVTLFICGVAASIDAQTAPTLAETKTWIESEGPAILDVTQRYRGGELVSKVSNLLFDTAKCQLSWDTNNGLHANVPLKDLDTGGFLISSSTFLGSAPAFSMRIKTRAAVGDTIDGWYESKPRRVPEISVSVRNEEDGKRLGQAFRRAAVLCGAPDVTF